MQILFHLIACFWFPDTGNWNIRIIPVSKVQGSRLLTIRISKITANHFDFRVYH